MAYDVTKLINLGQLKSVLQRLLSEITKVKSLKYIATIDHEEWVSYSGIFRYPALMVTSNYHNYSIHLSQNTTTSVGVMCANADVRPAIEDNLLYLDCYGTKPTADFDIQIIVTPIANNAVGLSCDIGNNFLTPPSTTSNINSRLSSVESDIPKLGLTASNITIATNRWSSSGVTGYPYKAVINMQNVTSDYFGIVQFSDQDVNTYDFSPTVTPGSGTVTVYCKTVPSGPITILNITCFRCTTVTAS